MVVNLQFTRMDNLPLLEQETDRSIVDSREVRALESITSTVMVRGAVREADGGCPTASSGRTAQARGCAGGRWRRAQGSAVEDRGLGKKKLSSGSKV